MSATESLIEYPCRFPIKVMGLAVDGFVEAMVAVASGFDPDFGHQHVEIRSSSAGRYMGVTLMVWVTHREQLDEVYRTLTTHPMVKVVL